VYVSLTSNDKKILGFLILNLEDIRLKHLIKKLNICNIPLSESEEYDI